jgi:iron complex outermembrane receptor protein
VLYLLVKKSLNVLLEEDANQLKEVVVQVGYGTVKKRMPQEQ